jgi:membrane fusion protein (multidrug efflux system)
MLKTTDATRDADLRAGSRGLTTRRAAVRLGLAAGVVVLLAVGGTLGLGWWTHGRFVQSTDDAYVRADEVTVEPKVSGYVDKVYVADNEAVDAGQPLARIDARSYDAALAQQAAAVDARRADIAAAQRQVAQQEAAVRESRARLDAARNNAAYAQGEAERYGALSRQGAETLERFGQAANQRDQAALAVKADAATVSVAERQVATLRAQIAQAQAQRDAAAAVARGARLNLDDTLIRASIAGRVGDKTVREGQFVQPGTRMMSVVPVQSAYLVANFKETQIGRMRIGQKASVRIDALGDVRIEGVVDSFAPGTGAQFALLPPENATGNFIKIAQRVPVRLRLNAPPALRDHLLPGLSATVSIDTTQAPDRGQTPQSGPSPSR